MFFYILTKRISLLLNRELGSSIKPDQIRTLCEGVNRELALLLDSEWIQENGDTKYEPLLTFCERESSTELDIGALRKIVLPKDETMFSEGADICAIMSIFDEDEDMIEPGSFRHDNRQRPNDA